MVFRDSSILDTVIQYTVVGTTVNMVVNCSSVCLSCRNLKGKSVILGDGVHDVFNGDYTDIITINNLGLAPYG